MKDGLAKVLALLKAMVVGLVATGTARRLLVFLVGAAATLASRKLGFELSSEQQAALVALVLGYLAQSGYKEAAALKAQAEADKSAFAAAVKKDS